MSAKTISSWHVGVAAEAFAAALFARYGYYVSVQYGANQPEYDLITESQGKMLKISVKGSQDGSWGLTQSFKKKGVSYHEAIDRWLESHHKRTIFCLVQFKGTAPNEMPRVYVASPEEIAERMKRHPFSISTNRLRPCSTGRPQADVFSSNAVILISAALSAFR